MLGVRGSARPPPCPTPPPPTPARPPAPPRRRRSPAGGGGSESGCAERTWEGGAGRGAWGAPRVAAPPLWAPYPAPPSSRRRLAAAGFPQAAAPSSAPGGPAAPRGVNPSFPSGILPPSCHPPCRAAPHPRSVRGAQHLLPWEPPPRGASLGVRAPQQLGQREIWGASAADASAVGIGALRWAVQHRELRQRLLWPSCPGVRVPTGRAAPSPALGPRPHLLPSPSRCGGADGANPAGVRGAGAFLSRKPLRSPSPSGVLLQEPGLGRERLFCRGSRGGKHGN